MKSWFLKVSLAQSLLNKTGPESQHIESLKGNKSVNMSVCEMKPYL